MGAPLQMEGKRGDRVSIWNITAVRQLEVQGVAGQILESPKSRLGEG